MECHYVLRDLINYFLKSQVLYCKSDEKFAFLTWIFPIMPGWMFEVPIEVSDRITLRSLQLPLASDLVYSHSIS